MLALINPAVLPALRIAATFFFIVNLLGGAYIFRNRHRFFDRDPNVDNDVPAVRHARVEVITIPWLFLTTLILILLISFWLLKRGYVCGAWEAKKHSFPRHACPPRHFPVKPKEDMSKTILTI